MEWLLHTTHLSHNLQSDYFFYAELFFLTKSAVQKVGLKGQSTPMIPPYQTEDCARYINNVAKALDLQECHDDGWSVSPWASTMMMVKLNGWDSISRQDLVGCLFADGTPAANGRSLLLVSLQLKNEQLHAGEAVYKLSSGAHSEHEHAPLVKCFIHAENREVSNDTPPVTYSISCYR